MGVDYLDYEKLVEAGLRSTVRHVLEQVAKEGLKDPHHFYITFATTHPDVVLPADVKKEHPDEITIVIQHMFEDLTIDAKKFSVSLTFDMEEAMVTVPFDSLINFSDPSQNFSLEFEPIIPASPTTAQKVDNKSKVISFNDAFKKK